MSKLNLPRVDFTKKRTEALTKFRSLRENFRKREKQIKADLQKTSKIWEKLGERFRWWGLLP